MASTTDDEPKANEADNPVADHAIAKQRILIFLLVYDASLAVMRNFMPKDDQVLDYVIGLPVLIPILIWCHLDAKERNHTIGILMKLCLVFFFVVAFPIYTFQTQGLRGFKTFTFVAFFTSGTIVLLLLRFF